MSPQFRSISGSLLLAIFAALTMASCTKGPYEVKYRGQAMGTTWSVKINSKNTYDPAVFAAIQSELDFVNTHMSNWEDDSDISRFNRSVLNSCTEVTTATLAVVLYSQRIANLSGGALDVTLSPLIEAWGFGKNYSEQDVPSEEDINTARAQTGNKRFYIAENGLCKRDIDIELNVSAIAKGYAVDRVAALLDEEGFTDYLVEVGGELKGRGFNGRGNRWTVGVEQPTADSLAGGYRTAVPLVDGAIATSGDYRNFFEAENVRYSHIIDPATGYPVTHNLASVTVLAPSSMEADAWATALLVMGPKKGMQMANSQSLAVMMILRNDEAFESITSEQWPKP